MNRRGEFNLGYLAIQLMLIVFGCMIFNIWDGGDGAYPKGTAFCISKGYDSTSYGGGYSEEFGKVNCISCYRGQCIEKEFNVTKNFLRIISEVQA